jgi:hypothetical protein
VKQEVQGLLPRYNQQADASSLIFTKSVAEEDSRLSKVRAFRSFHISQMNSTPSVLQLEDV